jgi:tryptophan synthase beta chain
VILTALCGHAHLDLPAYGQYLDGEIVDHELPAADIDRALAELPVPVSTS